MIWLQTRRHGSPTPRRPSRLELIGVRPGAIHFRVIPHPNFTGNIGDEVALRISSGGHNHSNDTMRDIRSLINALISLAILPPTNGEDR